MMYLGATLRIFSHQAWQFLVRVAYLVRTNGNRAMLVERLEPAFAESDDFQPCGHGSHPCYLSANRKPAASRGRQREQVEKRLGLFFSRSVAIVVQAR